MPPPPHPGRAAGGQAEPARRRYAEATLRMRRAQQARAEAEARRRAAESWRHEVHEYLRVWWAQAGERTAAAALRPPGRPGLTLFAADFLRVEEPAAIMSATLEAALALSPARMGNIQLYDAAAGGLRIVTQYGFGRDFLDFFALVDDRRSACGVALADARTVQVHDVERSELFGRGPARDVVLAAGVRAVRSIPLVSDGVQLGVLSVHYHKPHDPDPVERQLLATVASAGMRRLSRSAGS
ncbi:GAF domain-containing protein [Actinoplanes aureus]|uniref:GAF domain-containing protein n=1 Tax=Actinoplanes aureus TaxID=2792083 RepID=UPI0018C2315D|nr:GAF domain-containing protein [Actinoplanes aureus]